MKALAPELKVWGVGGPGMASEGAELLANCHKFATLGIIEPIKLLPFFAGLRARIIQEIKQRKPAAILLVDFGGFNIGLAQLLRPLFPELPIVYFISPQVWGSRPWRINVLKRCISKMLTIFPFEESIYKNHGVEARFVGNPITMTVPGATGPVNREQFCQQFGLDPLRPIIGIFPGSRKREITSLMPVLLDAVSWLKAERPELQFVVSRVNSVTSETLEAMLSRCRSKQKGITLLPPGENLSLMSASDILWTKSGTTTLEAALFGKPMLIFYRGNWISYWLVLLFKRVKRIGWPNLLAGKLVVPELIQLDCRAEQLVRYTRDWLDVPGARQEISESLKQVKGHLGQGDFAENTAREVLKTVGYRTAEAGSTEKLPE
jgi:lipid-A-disaccharide synthase